MTSPADQLARLSAVTTVLLISSVGYGLHSWLGIEHGCHWGVADPDGEYEFHPGHYLLNANSGAYTESVADVAVGLKLVSLTPGLTIHDPSGGVLMDAVDDMITLGPGSDWSIEPVFAVDGNAPPGSTYSATFILQDLRTSPVYGDSAEFTFDFGCRPRAACFQHVGRLDEARIGGDIRDPRPRGAAQIEGSGDYRRRPLTRSDCERLSPARRPGRQNRRLPPLGVPEDLTQPSRGPIRRSVDPYELASWVNEIES